jgi:SlyX protein
LSDDSLTDVEIKIAHLENQVGDLNTTVFHQQTKIEQLEGSLRYLNDKLEEFLESLDEGQADNEPPPHY